jgi:glucose/arabinose dehydrogenase
MRSIARRSTAGRASSQDSSIQEKGKPVPMRRVALVAAVVAVLASGGDVARATVPAGFTQTLVTGGLTRPTSMAFAPDGRIFVAEQGGTLRVIQNGMLLATPFVSLTVDSNGERGLLGVAFDPGFASNHLVYVYYTVPGSPPHNRVSHFTANGNVAMAGSEVPILDLENLSTATNHNGGAIHFGPDGKLYVAVGENANAANSQTLSNRLGKMLRINADGTIPTDNPFFNTPGANQAIWALGVRNPFTFTFQPGTGRMFINDVGNTTWEEVNDGIAGSNYGWNICEGFCSPPNPSFRDPLYVYNHTTGTPTGCAIIGGAFYNPATVTFPATYVGKYFFGDLCQGWIRYLDPASPATSTAFASGFTQLVEELVADDGSLYVLEQGAMPPDNQGALWRIAPTPTAVTATDFRASRRGSRVLLRWRPAGDPRVLGFVVSRGRVRLNRSLVCCSLLDRRPGHGLPVYRLEAVLADGSRVFVASATPR